MITTSDLTIFIAIIGLLVGSFLNAVIWRIHAKKSIAKGRSECPKCHHQLGVIDLIPVFSWLALRGRCRYCHKPISLQYPLVELATAILFTGSFLILSPTTSAQWVELVWWLIISACLIVLTVYDLRWMLLPDVVMIPAIAIAAVYLVYVGVTNPHNLYLVWGPVVAALIGGGFFYALAAVSNGRWMGGGDIKLAFLMGLILGPKQLLLAMVIGFDLAALVALPLIALRVKKIKDHMAFGPFLVVGTIVAFLFGAAIITWYGNLVASWFLGGA